MTALDHPKPPVRRILLVDDDTDFTALLGEFLLMHKPGEWEVHTAANYNQALTQLKAHSFNLVTLDLQMPVMDGLQFLTLLKRSYPGLQVIIVTGLATPENRAFCLQNGAVLVLDKLEVGTQFETMYAALDNVASAPVEGFRGMLRQVGLTDVVQMECLGRKSSVLEINSPNGAGRVFIEDGSIIHAECGSAQGEPALFRLMALAGGEFQLKPFLKPSRMTIDGHWESLLMEAMRLLDEAAATAPPQTPAEPDGAGPDPLLVPAEPLTEAHPLHAERSAEEIVLCSATGEVLYEWQSSGVEKRVRLMELLAAKSGAVGRSLALGQTERLVIETTDSRMIALLGPEHKIFLRVGVRWT
jgi:CheY-like chemotaxis protein